MQAVSKKYILPVLACGVEAQFVYFPPPTSVLLVSNVASIGSKGGLAYNTAAKLGMGKQKDPA